MAERRTAYRQDDCPHRVTASGRGLLLAPSVSPAKRFDGGACAPYPMGPRVSRALRKAHTPTTQSSVFTGGMDHSASLSAPARRTRRIVIVGLAILGAAIAAFGPVDAVLKILSMPMREPDWHGWVGTFNGVALITVAALPLAALAVWALARRRRATGQRRRGRGGCRWPRSASSTGRCRGSG